MQYHEATILPLFTILFISEMYNERAKDAIFTQQQGENTVVENADKVGEDSVRCPMWRWSIFKAGRYWKPFPY